MKKTVLIFCFLSGYLVLFFHLGSMPFYGADEPRYARVGQEMLENRDFVTPTLDHRPWLEKPPLLYWMESASYAVFGLNERAARLPNAILTLLAALAIGYLGWRITGEAWCGVYAYLILLSSFLFVLLGRVASTDMALTVPYALMLISAFLAIEEDSVGWACLAGFCGALAVLAKGPVGVVLALGTLFIYLLILRRYPSGKIFSGFALVLAVTALPWFILVWAANGENFFLTFIVNHHIARFVTSLHHHSQPFWYYIPVLIVGFFPWILFLFPAAKDFLKQNWELTSSEFRLRLFLWLWALIPLLFFSLSSAKLPGYILPSIPPLALIVSMEWRRYQEESLKILPGRSIQILLVTIAVLLAVALPVAAKLEYRRIDVGLSAGIPLLAGIILGVWWVRKRLVTISFLAITGGIIISMSALFAIGSPVFARYHSTAELVHSVVHEISDRQPLVQYRFFHHTAVYYSEGAITPDSLNSPQEMIEYVNRHPRDTYIMLTTGHGLEEFYSLQGTQVTGPVGKLYILKLQNQDRQLAQRIRESLIKSPAVN
jgi:4-amino-4-deoxy-L-arabinose transferase-like glycosyltransferase